MFPVGLWANGPIQLAYGCNIVLLASDVELSAEELLVRIAQRVEGRVSVKSFGLLGKDMYQGQIRSGDVPLLLDPPSRRR